MPALGEWQYALDDFVFGYGTAYPVNQFDVSYPELRTQDVDAPRADGITMGIDRQGGMTVSFDMEVVGQGEADTVDLIEEIRRAWYGTDKRLVPQSYQTLSYRTGGTGEQRRMYGRGRAWTPASLENLHVGYVPAAAQFACRDGFFYSDTEFSDTAGIIPDDTGGLIGDLIGPIYASTFGAGTSGLIVGGTEPAWAVTRVNGPIAYFTVEFVGQFTYGMDVELGRDESILVDPQPWQRSARMSNGGNAAGLFTGDSAWLADMRLPPGHHNVILRGYDPTGTSSVETYWRSVRASL